MSDVWRPKTIEESIAKFKTLVSFNLKGLKDSIAQGWTIDDGEIHAQYYTNFKDKDDSMINMVPGFCYIEKKDKREIVMIAVKDQKTGRSKMVAFQTVLFMNNLWDSKWNVCDLTKYLLV